MSNLSPQPESADGLSLELRGGLEAAAAARRALVAGDGAIAPQLREDVLLLMTELITNAVRHGAAGPEETLGVDVRWSQDWVRVEVTDPTLESRPARDHFARPAPLRRLGPVPRGSRSPNGGESGTRSPAPWSGSKSRPRPPRSENERR